MARVMQLRNYSCFSFTVPQNYKFAEDCDWGQGSWLIGSIISYPYTRVTLQSWGRGGGESAGERHFPIPLAAEQKKHDQEQREQEQPCNTTQR